MKHTIEMRTQRVSSADIQLKRYENELNVKPHEELTFSRKSMHTKIRLVDMRVKTILKVNHSQRRVSLGTED